MNCPNCNKQILENQRKCPFCGTSTVPPLLDRAPVYTKAPVYQPPEPSVPAEIDRTEINTEGQEVVGYVPEVHIPQEELAPESNPPAVKLRTDYKFIKVFFLSIITLGIYGLVIYHKTVKDVNTVCTPHDNKKTMGFIPALLLTLPSFGIVMLVWQHRIANRIGAELARRNSAVKLSAKDFWCWNILGVLIIVGPFVYASKYFKAINAMNQSYNNIG
jgi:hypothetical protein